MVSRPLTTDIPFHEWSDTGIDLFGRFGMFGYEAALITGPLALTEEGIPITDIRDNNQNKAWVGRINAYLLLYLRRAPQLQHRSDLQSPIHRSRPTKRGTISSSATMSWGMPGTFTP